MKASQVIRLALDTKYAPKYYYGGAYRKHEKHEFMCHAIKALADDHDFDPYEVMSTFQPILENHNTNVIDYVLIATNKKYAAYKKRWSWNCNACFKIRVAFWEEHIKMLESKGL